MKVFFDPEVSDAFLDLSCVGILRTPGEEKRSLLSIDLRSDFDSHHAYESIELRFVLRCSQMSRPVLRGPPGFAGPAHVSPGRRALLERAARGGSHYREVDGLGRQLAETCGRSRRAYAGSARRTLVFTFHPSSFWFYASFL